MVMEKVALVIMVSVVPAKLYVKAGVLILKKNRTDFKLQGYYLFLQQTQ